MGGHLARAGEEVNAYRVSFVETCGQIGKPSPKFERRSKWILRI